MWRHNRGVMFLGKRDSFPISNVIYVIIPISNMLSLLSIHIAPNCFPSNLSTWRSHRRKEELLITKKRLVVMCIRDKQVLSRLISNVSCLAWFLQRRHRLLLLVLLLYNIHTVKALMSEFTRDTFPLIREISNNKKIWPISRPLFGLILSLSRYFFLWSLGTWSLDMLNMSFRKLLNELFRALISQNKEGSTEDKLDFWLLIPVTAFIYPAQLSGSLSFTELLSSGSLEYKHSDSLPLPAAVNFSQVMLLAVIFNLRVMGSSPSSGANVIFWYLVENDFKSMIE